MFWDESAYYNGRFFHQILKNDKACNYDEPSDKARLALLLVSYITSRKIGK